MAALDNLTNVFVGHYAKNESEKQEVLDPTTIISFAELIFELIKKIQECRGTSPASVKEIAHKPTFGQNFALRRHLISTMGRQEFKRKGDKVHEALIAAAKDADQADIDEVWEQNA